MRSTNHVAAVAALVCGLAMGTAPFAHGTGGEILSGTYDVVTPTSTNVPTVSQCGAARFVLVVTTA